MGAKADKRARKEGDELAVPNWTAWTKADWRDFYETLAEFNIRFRKRHEADGRPRCPVCNWPLVDPKNYPNADYYGCTPGNCCIRPHPHGPQTS